MSLDLDGSRCAPWTVFTALVALGFILLVDYYFKISSPRILVVAVLDETAHFATSIIVIAAFFRALNLWFACGCFVGGMLIDIDHLPAMLSQSIEILDADRPATHSVFVVILVVVAALYFPGRSQPVLLGAALGVSVHLLRDLATGGVPLLWPASPEIIEISYWVYAIGIIVVALIPLIRYFDRTVGRSRIPRVIKSNTSKQVLRPDSKSSDF